MNIELLQSQHDALRLLAERVLLAVADEGSPQPLGALRWQFARELMAHLALEDHIFYPSMKRRADDSLRETVAQLQVEVAPLAQSFSQYMAQWNDDRIARDWRSFCQETRDMIEAIMRRIDKENRLLKALTIEAGSKAPQIRRAG